MDAVTWPCLYQILSWIPHPKYFARLARTCKGLRDTIEAHQVELGILFLKNDVTPLAWACAHRHPLYTDLCFEMGLEGSYPNLAISVACERGLTSVIKRMLESPRVDRNLLQQELLLWRACRNGHLDIIRLMVEVLGAVMVRSGIELAKVICNDPAPVVEYLEPLLGKRNQNGDLYF